jgi:hypothetical protein
MRIVSFDPSLRNWGVAILDYDPIHDVIEVVSVDVIKTKPIKKSKLPKSQQDLEAAQALIQGVLDYASSADVIVIELPIGSQSAAAMKSYGICIGITACLTELQIPFIYKSPYDIKRVVGKKETSKEEIIDWVHERHPNKLSKYKNSAEHQADAIVAAYSALPELRKLANANHLNP